MIVSVVTALFSVCVAVALLIESQQSSPALLSLARLLTWIPMAAFVVCMFVFRNKTWLGRAIAVVGGRPDIGYAGFARLPGIARITAMTKWNLAAYSAMALLLVGVYLDHGLSNADRRSAWAVVFLLLVPLSLGPLFWQANARRELQKLLKP